MLRAGQLTCLVGLMRYWKSCGKTENSDRHLNNGKSGKPITKKKFPLIDILNKESPAKSGIRCINCPYSKDASSYSSNSPHERVCSVHFPSLSVCPINDRQLTDNVSSNTFEPKAVGPGLLSDGTTIPRDSFHSIIINNTLTSTPVLFSRFVMRRELSSETRVPHIGRCIPSTVPHGTHAHPVRVLEARARLALGPPRVR